MFKNSQKKISIFWKGSLLELLLMISSFSKAYCAKECVGAVVCKLDQHRKDLWRGYIAMLVVHKDYRRYKIGKILKNLDFRTQRN